jgi:hypothetical protein
MVHLTSQLIACMQKFVVVRWLDAPSVSCIFINGLITTKFVKACCVQN